MAIKNSIDIVDWAPRQVVPRSSVGTTEFEFSTVRDQGLWGKTRSVARRGFDIGFSLFALVVTAPIFLLLIALTRLSSPGPALYKHRRIGQHGTEFDCLKFRTMVPNADAVLEEILESSPELRREFEMDHKLKVDPRVTSVGRLLRRVSLDELPQFWNVLRGEMSVVGPRPIVEEEIVKYGQDLPIVLSVKPGLTGLWQVSGRNDIEYSERVALDREYVMTQNFWSDLRIIVRTIGVLFREDSGAY